MISDFNPASGPDPKMLEGLFKSLPGMAKHIAKRVRKADPRKIITLGPANGKAKEACQICGSLFSHILKPGQDENLLPATCGTCQRLLDDGWTAFVTVGRYAFAKSPGYPEDWPGTIQHIQPATMIAMVERAGVQAKEKETNGDEHTPPAA